MESGQSQPVRPSSKSSALAEAEAVAVVAAEQPLRPDSEAVAEEPEPLSLAESLPHCLARRPITSPLVLEALEASPHLETLRMVEPGPLVGTVNSWEYRAPILHESQQLAAVQEPGEQLQPESPGLPLRIAAANSQPLPQAAQQAEQDSVMSSYMLQILQFHLCQRAVAVVAASMPATSQPRVVAMVEHLETPTSAALPIYPAVVVASPAEAVEPMRDKEASALASANSAPEAEAVPHPPAERLPQWAEQAAPTVAVVVAVVAA